MRDKRFLEEVEILRTDGNVYKVDSAVVHSNVVAFLLEGKSCMIPLANVGLISAARDVTEEEE